MILNHVIKKPVMYWLFLLALIFLSTACDDNQSLPIDNNKIRIIALAPHLSNLANAAGALDNLVAVVSYSKPLNKEVQIIGDAFKLDFEAIVALQPDYVLAWKDGTPIANINTLKSLGLTVIETKINALADIPKTIAQIAELTHTQKFAQKSIDKFNNTIQAIKNQKYSPQTAFIQLTTHPLYTVSPQHWMSEAIHLCGYTNVFQEIKLLSVPVSLEAVITHNPQAIINLTGQIDEKWLEWPEIAAVKNQQIIQISPDVFSRPSLQILEGIAQLCQFRN